MFTCTVILSSIFCKWKCVWDFLENLCSYKHGQPVLSLVKINWLNGFHSRHKISFRKLEVTILNRVRVFDKDEVDLFYEKLDTVMTKYNIPPNPFHNMEETGISTIQKRQFLNHEYRSTWEALRVGSKISLWCAMSALGLYTPPLFIYRRKRMSSLLQRVRWRGSCSSVNA